jgi:hypothetical protein
MPGKFQSLTLRVDKATKKVTVKGNRRKRGILSECRLDKTKWD